MKVVVLVLVHLHMASQATWKHLVIQDTSSSAIIEVGDLILQICMLILLLLIGSCKNVGEVEVGSFCAYCGFPSGQVEIRIV